MSYEFYSIPSYTDGDLNSPPTEMKLLVTSFIIVAILLIIILLIVTVSKKERREMNK